MIELNHVQVNTLIHGQESQPQKRCVGPQKIQLAGQWKNVTYYVSAPHSKKRGIFILQFHDLRVLFLMNSNYVSSSGLAFTPSNTEPVSKANANCNAPCRSFTEGYLPQDYYHLSTFKYYLLFIFYHEFLLKKHQLRLFFEFMRIIINYTTTCIISNVGLFIAKGVTYSPVQDLASSPD